MVFFVNKVITFFPFIQNPKGLLFLFISLNFHSLEQAKNLNKNEKCEKLEVCGRVGFLSLKFYY